MPSKKPEQPVPKRTRLTAFYLTDHDHQKVREFAARGGFKSTSHFITALLEPIIQEDLSFLSFTRSCKRLQKFMKAHGVRFEVDTSSFAGLGLFPPPPPSIPDEPLSVEQLRKDFDQVIEVLELEQRTKPKPKQPYV